MISKTIPKLAEALCEDASLRFLSRQLVVPREERHMIASVSGATRGETRFGEDVLGTVRDRG